MYENNYQQQFNGMQQNQMMGQPSSGMPQNNWWMNQMNQQGQQPQITSVRPQQQRSQPPTYIPGRIVQNEEEIVASEVPQDGNYSTFIQQDFQKIYLKTWGNKGLINTKKYELVEENGCPISNSPDQKDPTTLILERLDRIEEQLKNQAKVPNNYRNGNQKKDQNRNQEGMKNE